MAMTWNTLTSSSTTAGSVANWMSKASISSGSGGVADIIVQEACSWIYRRLRHWKMLTAPTSLLMVVGDPQLPLQTGMLEPMDLWYINGGAPYFMTQKTPTQIYQTRPYNSAGVLVNQPPSIYSFNLTAIEMDCPPDQAYQSYITYYKQLDALSGSNPTNFLTETYPRMLRCAVMAGACEWTKDNGQGSFDRTYWDQLCEDEIYKAQAESDRARRGEVNSGVLIGGAEAGWPMYSGSW